MAEIIIFLFLFNTTSAALLHNVSRQSRRSDLSSQLPAVTKKESTAVCVCVCAESPVLKRPLFSLPHAEME